MNDFNRKVSFFFSDCLLCVLCQISHYFLQKINKICVWFQKGNCNIKQALVSKLCIQLSCFDFIRTEQIVTHRSQMCLLLFEQSISPSDSAHYTHTHLVSDAWWKKMLNNCNIKPNSDIIMYYSCNKPIFHHLFIPSDKWMCYLFDLLIWVWLVFCSDPVRR